MFNEIMPWIPCPFVTEFFSIINFILDFIVSSNSFFCKIICPWALYLCNKRTLAQYFRARQQWNGEIKIIICRSSKEKLTKQKFQTNFLSACRGGGGYSLIFSVPLIIAILTIVITCASSLNFNWIFSKSYLSCF